MLWLCTESVISSSALCAQSPSLSPSAQPRYKEALVSAWVPDTAVGLAETVGIGALGALLYLMYVLLRK